MMGKENIRSVASNWTSWPWKDLVAASSRRGKKGAIYGRPTMPGRLVNMHFIFSLQQCQEDMVILYYRWEEAGIKKFRNLLQVTQLVSNRTQLWTWISATPAYFPPSHSASYSSPSVWSRKCLVPIASHWAWSAASSRCGFSGVSHLPLPPFWSREFVYVEAASGHGIWPRCTLIGRDAEGR